jgi:Family of unknown function (DUF6178)
MPKPDHRHDPNPASSESLGQAARQSDARIERNSFGRDHLLDRILEIPQLPQVVPRLPPEVLHRVIESCGLEDCGEIVALASADQLARVFDLDLWRSPGPGVDEQLDAARFGVWLEVLLESGPAVAAEKLIAIDDDLVIAALAQLVHVFDRAAVEPYTTTDGEVIESSRRKDDSHTCEIGGYVFEAVRIDFWDAVASLMVFLSDEHSDHFHRLMRGCRHLSNSGFEVDGPHDLLTDREQDLFEVAVDRDERREKQGYVAPADARRFLDSARQLDVTSGSAPPFSPIARGYFRTMGPDAAPGDRDDAHVGLLPAPASSPKVSPSASTNGVAALVDLLLDVGLLPEQPRALLEAPHDHAPRLTRLQAEMQFAYDAARSAYSRRTEELAFLANTLIAGCSVQARPFTPREASDAAAAICNLGLENWPINWAATSDGFLVTHDLIAVFQVGWRVLYSDVGMYAAERLIDVLSDLRHADVETRGDLERLRAEMTKQWRAGAPWRARDALDPIMVLDAPAWATLLGLLSECPVLCASLGPERSADPHRVSATAFEFVSENTRISSIRTFMASLAETLDG